MTVAAAPAARPRAVVPPVLVAGFALFLAAIAWLVASSLATRQVPTYAPTPLRAAGAEQGATVGARGTGSGDASAADTLTIAAADEHAWHFVDLARGQVLAPGERAAWDLAVRRYHIVPATAAADLGTLPSGAPVSPASVPLIATTFAAETTNAAIQRWYRYGMLTHLLTPKGHTYLVRGHAGREFALEVLSYYCPGPTAGCMTIRFRRLARERSPMTED